MEVFTKNKKLGAALMDERVCQQRFGTIMAKKLKIRVGELRAAESLATFWPPRSPPERCHELKGDRRGTFSIDLNHPYRLLFKPNEDDPPQDRSNEQEHWASINKIELIKIEDTHG